MGTVAITSTGTRSRAIAAIAATHAAAPPMSDFMVLIDVPVLRFKPPESNVIPLPTRAIRALERAGR